MQHEDNKTTELRPPNGAYLAFGGLKVQLNLGAFAANRDKYEVPKVGTAGDFKTFATAVRDTFKDAEMSKAAERLEMLAGRSSNGIPTSASSTTSRRRTSGERARA